MMRRSLLVLLLVCATRFVCAGDKAEPIDIPVVHTFEELAKAPEITLSSGNKVRVGIEADTAPVGAQVMVYVLGKEGEIETQITREAADISKRIGPLLIHREKSEKDEKSAVDNLEVIEKELQRAGVVLWCNAVTVGKDETSFELEEFTPASFELKDFTPASDEHKRIPLAKAKISASKLEFHPWRVLGMPNDLEKMQELAESDVAVLRVNAAEQHRAEVEFDGARPALFVDDETLDSDERLPYLLTSDDIEAHETLTKEQRGVVDRLIEKLSSEEFDDRENASRELLAMLSSAREYFAAKRAGSKDPEVRNRLSRILNTAESGAHVEWSDGRIHIDLPTPIVFESERDAFLFRWWLNGKPLVLEDRARDIIEKASVQLEEVHGVDLELADFDARSLGAKSGDQITVQVLYSPHGSSPSGEKTARALRQEMETVDDRPIISNKFTITVK